MDQPIDHCGLPGQSVCAGFTGGFPEPSDCLVKRGKPELVPDGRLRAGSEQRLDAWWMTLEAGFVQGRVSLPVLGVYLRAFFQEQCDERQIAFCCRSDEGRGSSGVAGFDIGATLEQHQGPGGNAFGECRVDRLFRVSPGHGRRRPFFQGASLTGGPASDNHEADGAGNAGAVVQATHGYPSTTSLRMQE